MPKVSVVIVNWNVAAALKRCVKSVQDTKYPNLELIVIDNNSDVKPKTVTIQNDKNIGFPAAVNQGLKRATGDYVLILNPDARVPADLFVKSIQFIDGHPDAGVMGPKLVNLDGTTQGSVFDEPTLFKPTLKYTPSGKAPVAVDAISGACMFMPKRTLDKVGLFTEEVFMYYEDMDYCRRIRRLGLKVYFNQQITVVHEHGASAKQNVQASDWRSYLWKSSLWYNGPVKHYLMWFISLVGQKLRL